MPWTSLITKEEESRGIVKGRVQRSHVTVTITRASEHSVQRKVKVRNQLLMPDLDVAPAVCHRIMERLQ